MVKANDLLKNSSHQYISIKIYKNNNNNNNKNLYSW